MGQCLATRTVSRKSMLKSLSAPICLVFGLPILLSAAANEWRLLLSPFIGMALFAVAHPICHFRGCFDRTAFTSRAANAKDFAHFPNANVWDGIACESVEKSDTKLRMAMSEKSECLLTESHGHDEEEFMAKAQSVSEAADVELVCVKSDKMSEESRSADEMKESLLSVEAEQQSMVAVCV